ncbi:MAG: ribonuclease HII [Armatimonadota bacterium]|nr:ribonuclease HII [Armatimonadota bacterium]
MGRRAAGLAAGSGPPTRLPFFDLLEEGAVTCPHTRFEEALFAAGRTRVAGVDEAGRGPIAGPVVAAAVILPFPCPIAGIDDSKRLSPARREALNEAIHQHAIAVGVGTAGAALIDRINILEATRLAMRQALAALEPAPDAVLVDAVRLPELPWPHYAVIGGDRLCLSVAAASIVAKVTRDRLLRELDQRYPQYGFAQHKGYPTPQHLECLVRYGPCPEHRRTFAPVRQALAETTHLNLHEDERRPPLWTGP